MSFLNKFGLSIRGKGKINEKNEIESYQIDSYDLVSEPGISFSDTLYMLEKIQQELARQRLLEERKNKIMNINNL